MTAKQPENRMQNIGNPLQIPNGREGLTDYIRSFDRNAPPYYAGRKRLLSGIEDICGEIWEKHEQNLQQRKGLTRVIYGAPGAGKSSTLMFLQHAWQQGVHMTADATGCERPGPTPVMLYSGSGGILHSLPMLCEDLVDLVAPERSKDLFVAFSETIRVSSGGSAGFVKGGIEREKTTHYEAVTAGLKTVAKLLPPEQWKRPVVIGVDEAQNLPGDRHSPVGELLQALHANDVNLPVLVVLAGLSDSRERISELGLSRLSKHSIYSMNGLDAAEIEELKEGFCVHFDIDLGNHADEFDALLQRTDGWAAHLQ
ncbi:MAG: ATP-binding protein, partial [Gammaproteobacteria bacterium]|nr:ATP-binding protein [Gammaproteobacteria bacterium]